MDFLEYIVEEGLVIIPALWFVGYMLKQTPKVADWCIPYILTALGIVASLALIGTEPANVVQGILVAGTAVLGHQLVKQTNVRDGGKK